MEKTITRFLRSALLTAASAIGMAQIGQAQVSSYMFRQTSTNYNALTTGSVLAQATGIGGGQRLDDGNFAVSLPFTFNFNGSNYTTATVNANGYITFGTSGPAANLTSPISSAGAYSGAVSAFGTNIEGVYEFSASMLAGSNRLTSVSRLNALQPGQTVTGQGIPLGTTILSVTNGEVILSNPLGATLPGATLTLLSGKITTQTIGTSPNRTFVIQWEGFKQVGALNSWINFQIQLSEAGGVAAAQSVAAVYGPSMFSGLGAAEIGLRGAGNADFNNRLGSFNLTNTTAGAANSSTVSYSPQTVIPTGLTLTWSRQALPACSGTPAAGTAISSYPSSCAGNLGLMAPGAASGAGISYQWQSSSSFAGPYTDIAGATTNPYTAPSANNFIFYRLNVKCGSVTTSSVPAVVNNDELNVRLGNDTTLCPDASITLDAGNAGSDFLWSGLVGNTSQELTVASGGTYSVRVTDPVSGCIGRDTIAITSVAAPTVSLGADRAICMGATLSLNAGNTGGTFLWNTGATTQAISINRAGAFSVKVTNSNGCVNGDTINISVDPLPSVSFIAYNGNMPTLSFSASNPQHVTSYYWNFDDNGATSTSPTPTHTFSRIGNFNVRLAVANNCGSDTVVEVVRITTTGIGQVKLDENTVSLSPNPANDYILLDNKANVKLQEVQVVNMIGATVLKQNGNNSNMRVNTNGLPSGTYLVRIVTDLGIVVKKLEILK